MTPTGAAEPIVIDANLDLAPQTGHAIVAVGQPSFGSALPDAGGEGITLGLSAVLGAGLALVAGGLVW